MALSILRRLKSGAPGQFRLWKSCASPAGVLPVPGRGTEFSLPRFFHLILLNTRIYHQNWPVRRSTFDAPELLLKFSTG